MRGIAPEKMTVEQLREAVSIMSRREGGLEPLRLSQWSRVRCTEWLKQAGAPNGIGNFCRDLLRVVVGRTDEGFTVGLSYAKMVELIRVHYPCSMADEKHLRWYATSMRAAGEMVPVYRERSRWKKKRTKQ